VNGIRMDLREIGWGGVDWIRLAQDRDRWRDVVSAVMNLRVLAPRSWLVRLWRQNVDINRILIQLKFAVGSETALTNFKHANFIFTHFENAIDMSYIKHLMCKSITTLRKYDLYSALLCRC
jgi:hypothetical protein